jgi:hypothetical protein
MTLTADLDAVFRAARRRDWVFVGQCHLLAMPISIGTFAALCASKHDPPFFLVPHFLYWTVVGVVWSLRWPFAFFGVACMVVFPIGLYRSLCYYRHAGTSSLLAAGLRGRWAQQPGHRSVPGALALGFLPTALLVQKGATRRWFEAVDPPIRRPNAMLMRWLVALWISFHHLPFNYAVQVASCVRAPWTLTLPNWAGPCTTGLGYEPGARVFGCSDRP